MSRLDIEELLDNATRMHALLRLETLQRDLHALSVGAGLMAATGGGGRSRAGKVDEEDFVLTPGDAQLFVLPMEDRAGRGDQGVRRGVRRDGGTAGKARGEVESMDVEGEGIDDGAGVTGVAGTVGGALEHPWGAWLGWLQVRVCVRVRLVISVERSTGLYTIAAAGTRVGLPGGKGEITPAFAASDGTADAVDAGLIAALVKAVDWPGTSSVDADEGEGEGEDGVRAAKRTRRGDSGSNDDGGRVVGVGNGGTASPPPAAVHLSSAALKNYSAVVNETGGALGVGIGSGAQGGLAARVAGADAAAAGGGRGLRGTRQRKHVTKVTHIPLVRVVGEMRRRHAGWMLQTMAWRVGLTVVPAVPLGAAVGVSRGMGGMGGMGGGGRRGDGERKAAEFALAAAADMGGIVELGRADGRVLYLVFSARPRDGSGSSGRQILPSDSSRAVKSEPTETKEGGGGSSSSSSSFSSSFSFSATAPDMPTFSPKDPCFPPVFWIVETSDRSTEKFAGGVGRRRGGFPGSRAALKETVVSCRVLEPMEEVASTWEFDSIDGIAVAAAGTCVCVCVCVCLCVARHGLQ